MSITKSVTKWWFAWEPEKIEDWLEQMEAEGWHVYNATNNGIRFHFTKGEPRLVRYCADYQNTTSPEYKKIFQDAGWELVYSSIGWYIWRMEYEGERPNIYTDTDSLLDRNKRLIILLSILIVAPVVNFSTFAAAHVYDITISLPIGMIYLTLISLAGYGLYRLLAYNNRLKANKKI